MVASQSIVWTFIPLEKVLRHFPLIYPSILQKNLAQKDINNVHLQERGGLSKHFGSDLHVPL